MKMYFGRLLFVLLVAMAVVVFIEDKTLFRVEEIHIKVNAQDGDRVAWVDLNEAIKKQLARLRGRSIWQISLKDIQKELSAYQSLRDLTIHKSWPNTIEITYSLPVLRAIHQSGEGEFRILAEDGQWLGPLRWSRLPELPWIKGDWVQRKPEAQNNLLNLLQQLPAEGLMTFSHISEIQFNEIDGFLLTLIKSGQQIRFGTDNFQIKSIRVAQVLDYLQNRGLESRVIDANFSKKVLVRLRNHP
jgi:cell division protein FtsQ